MLGHIAFHPQLGVELNFREGKHDTNGHRNHNYIIIAPFKYLYDIYIYYIYIL